LSFVRAFAIVRFEVAAAGLVELVAQPRLDLGGLGMGVPDLERGHRGEPPHRLAIAEGPRLDDAASVLVGVVVVPRGDLQARGQALDIPFPRRGMGLVEVVDVEDQAALRGCEYSEVAQVGVAAGLNDDP
jgi:hypothetical protein